MAASASVRSPAVSGLFYPSEPDALRRQVEGFFHGAPRKAFQGKVCGVIAPHAGYVYSGPTAAAAYSHLEGKRFDVVVVISPSHREYFPGVTVYPGSAYSTPLGKIAVDAEVRADLLEACPLVSASESGHRDEHAIEVQLPFLQAALGEFSLLPLVMGDQKRETCLQLGRALASVLRKKNALLVASTDLSHYHAARVADVMDQVVVEDLRRFDYEQLLTDLDAGVAEACGGGPAAAVLAALSELGVKHLEVTDYRNSGDVTGDKRSVVGYCSAVAWK